MKMANLSMSDSETVQLGNQGSTGDDTLMMPGIGNFRYPHQAQTLTGPLARTLAGYATDDGQATSMTGGSGDKGSNRKSERPCA